MKNRKNYFYVPSDKNFIKQSTQCTKSEAYYKINPFNNYNIYFGFVFLR